MKFRWYGWIVVWNMVVWSMFGGMGVSSADPCGMVPPPYTGAGIPITRVGPQKTYVFYKNGMQSIVLRPAFAGKVDNFGMLIPFPTPPSIRKVPDSIFAQIAAAIDPPEIPVYLWRRRFRGYYPMAKPSAPALAVTQGARVRRDEVRVLRQEAVGMYEVAVLEAGSAKALHVWMKRHGYIYPKGMDQPVNEYVAQGWCFVAVKTRVAGQHGIQPHPGMRKARPHFPPGGSFTGAVQAMGFRFRSPKLVVPMRLSAYNAGRLRNVVYILTSGPRAIRNIPKPLVVRQVSGKELYDNVTKLLPIRVYGGEPHQIPRYQWESIQSRRNPVPHNGLARDLFASDIEAAHSQQLVLDHETRKKLLLNVGEELRLRGESIDQLNRETLQTEVAYTVQESLRALRHMTMTVIDGDFARDILARDNLTFYPYRMPASEQQQQQGKCPYNARYLQRQCTHGGILTRWQGPLYARPKAIARIRKPVVKMRKIPKQARTVYQWIAQFDDYERVNQALNRLVSLGKQAIPYLVGEALEGHDLVRRGWSIVALTRLAHLDGSIQQKLALLSQDPKQPQLLRIWAVAGQILLAKTFESLQGFTRNPYQYGYPAYQALQRPMRLRIQALLQQQSKASVRNIFLLARQFPFLHNMLLPMAQKAGPEKLARLMTTDTDMEVRRQAASYLAALGRQQAAQVAQATLRVYRFDAQATQVPWHGGPLYVPFISWHRKDAQQLVQQLLTWYVWCHRHKQTGQLHQIHNNLRSVQLAYTAGYQSPGWSLVGLDRWIAIWKQAVGCVQTKAIFQVQYAEKEFLPLLQRIGCHQE